MAFPRGFQLLYMTLAIDKVDGRDLSNTARDEPILPAKFLEK